MDFQAYAVRELTALAERLADAAKTQLDATTAQMNAAFETTMARLRNDQAQVVNENERLTAENAALQWEKEQMLEAGRTAARGPLIDCLADVFERMAASRSVGEALVSAGQGLIGEFGRVAVYAGDTLLVQLGAETPAIDPTAPSVTAFPVTIRGENLGTIYTTDEVRAAGEGVRIADLLRRHLTLTLERLTIELRTVGELRAYAQMLLDEVEYVFNADTSANLGAADRRERLTENLRCARQIYGQRVTLEGPAAVSVLDDVLSTFLDARAETAFGRELAEVATAPTLQRM